MARSQIALSQLKKQLDEAYSTFNHSRFLEMDPLGLVLKYPEDQDRELVAFICALFAYGQVTVMKKAIQSVLNTLGDNPRLRLMNSQTSWIKKNFDSHYYRFYSSADVQKLLIALKEILLEFSSLENFFIQYQALSILDSLSSIRRDLLSRTGNRSNGLQFMFADPQKSTAKRWHLFLRWMIRKDKIDLGLWTHRKSSELIQPLDTHVFVIAKSLGLITQKSPSLKAALELTECFKKWNAEDPIQYDFALCQIGIRKMRDHWIQQF